MYCNADELCDGEILTDYDLCIVGAGAAGIAMATQFLNAPKKVLLLSSGISTDRGRPSGDRESLYRGTVGPFMQQIDAPFLTRSRQRMYGGTTNHFGFWAAPLTEADLRARPGYRDAHWPFGIEELNKYYPEANTFGDYGPFNYDDIEFWANEFGGTPFPPRPHDLLLNAIFHAQYREEVKDFQVAHGPALEASQNVTVLFNANVLTVQTDSARGHVVGLSCATIEDGRRGRSFGVELGDKGTYVLAQGGIEPVRLLKISGDLGDNAKGMLGKGFMVHPLVQRAATVSFDPPVGQLIQNFFREHEVRLTTDSKTGELLSIREPIYHPEDLDQLHVFRAWGVLAPTPAAMDGERMGDFRVILRFSGGFSTTIDFNWEQVPNENSKITLDARQRDPIFDQPVVNLDWNLLEPDKRTIQKGLVLCNQYLKLRGATDFRSIDLSGGPEQWPPGTLQPGDHHMGALRMSQQAADGIVNPDSRMHSVDNLYVAGCGVFPTSGYANPTLTIVALALRLADHLKGLR